MSALPALFALLMKRIPFLFLGFEDGARTSIYVATSLEMAGVSGRFFLRCRERKSCQISYDTEVAARLWSISKTLCGSPVPSNLMTVLARSQKSVF
jgi:hypothetical protein